MKTVQNALARLALLPALLLVSCLDYREELWIEGDGSGRIEATIAIDSELGAPTDGGSGQPDKIEAQLRELFAATEGAKLESYQTQVQGTKRIWDFTVSFRDLRKLKPALAAGRGNIGAVFGDFEIERIPDGRLSVRRTVSFDDGSPPAATDPAAPGEGIGQALGKAFGGLLANTMFAGRNLDYITHFPTEVIGANSSAINRETNTVTWRIPLAQASQGPVVMSAEIKRPGGWLLWGFGIFLLVVTAAIVIPALRKKRGA
jgi:hypothetical protein